MGPPIPLTAIAAILLLGGAVLLLRSLVRLAATVRARFTRGAPYRRGQIGDRLFGLALAALLAPSGAVLLVLALGQAAFQPVHPGEAVRVGQVETSRPGWGRTRVVFTPDPAYPERRSLDGEIEGARWAIVGDYLDWEPGVRWLGLVPAQRVRGLIGAADVGGGAAAGGTQAPIDAMPRMARRLVSWDRWLPVLRVRTVSTPWFPQADRAIAILYATPDGYVTDRAALP